MLKFPKAAYALIPGLILLRFLGSRAEAPQVETAKGAFRGTHVEATTGPPGRSCAVFHGIPFAAAPLGERRFAKPAPLSGESWSEPKDATTPGKPCYQMTALGRNNLDGSESEDCLTLSILLPPGQEATSLTSLPVLFYIHGGGFVRGGGAAQHPAEGACGTLAAENVIVVFIQYRLGLFGFLADPEKGLEGNLGLWDQLAALNWVRENIRSFGGDPERISLAGCSAGGVSVSLLSLLPASQGLFASSSAMSGSAWAYWGLNEDSVNWTRQLGHAAGCQRDQLLACLRAKDPTELIRINTELFGPALFGNHAPKGAIGGGHNAFRSLTFGWNPRVDGDLIPADAESMARKLGKAMKPHLTGTTSAETTLILAPPSGGNDEAGKEGTFQIHGEKCLDRTLYSVAADGVRRLFSGDPERLDSLAELVKAVYLDAGYHARPNSSHLTEQMIRLTGDVWMDVPALTEADVRTKAGGKVHLYSYDHFLRPTFPPDWKFKGGVHGGDLRLMFTADKDVEAADLRVRSQLTEMFASMARHGRPAMSGIASDPPLSGPTAWPAFASLKRPTNVRIRGSGAEVRQSFGSPSTTFWTIVAPAMLRKGDELHTEL